MDSPDLGTLDWQPAAEHLELLAPPVAGAVQALGLECSVAPIDPELADTAAFCAAYDVPLAASANCVVVAGRRAGTTTTAACLVLALDRADVNGVVRRRLDVRKISFAGLEDAVRRTQMEHGGITPLGLPDDWPVLVDTRGRRPLGGGRQRHPGQQDRRPRCRAGRAAAGRDAGPRGQRSRLTMAARPTTTITTR